MMLYNPNVDLVNDNLVKFCPFILKIWSKNLILESIKGRYSVANLRKFTILTLILSMMMCIQNLVLFCQFVFKILSKNRILTSIKGRNSLQFCEKQRFTILALILSMMMFIQFFFSIGQGQLTPLSMVGSNSDVNQGSLLCCKFAKI